MVAQEDDPDLDVNDKKSFFHHLLERIDWQRDMHFQTQTTMDTLDYSSGCGGINSGSKVVFVAAGNKKRILIPFPLPMAQFSAKLFELMPKPILTRDQLTLLKYDNVASGKYKTNSEIGIPSKRYFNDEIKKYCYMWRDGGQFSTEKYNSNNDLNNATNSN